MTTLLTKWEDLVGKTITKYEDLSPGDCLHFDDGTCAVVILGGECDDDSVELATEASLWRDDRFHLGLITREQYDAEIAEEERRREEVAKIPPMELWRRWKHHHDTVQSLANEMYRELVKSGKLKLF